MENYPGLRTGSRLVRIVTVFSLLYVNVQSSVTYEFVFAVRKPYAVEVRLQAANMEDAEDENIVYIENGDGGMRDEQSIQLCFSYQY